MLSAILLVVGLSISFGQLGIRAGVNFSNVNIKFGGLELSADSKLGFHDGLVYDLNVGNKITFRPGALFSMKGTQAEDITTGETTSTSFDYLEIPLSFVYTPSEDGRGLFIDRDPI